MDLSHVRWDLGLRSLVRTEWPAMFTRRGLREDFVAAFTVALVAVPLSLAIALASDVPPGVGLATAIVGGIVCGLFGGTPLSVSGPAAAMAVLTASVVEKHGFAGLVFVVLIAGALQIATGVFGLGRLIRFVPAPVISGFTAGIGAIILIGQLPRLLGLTPPPESHVFDVIRHVGVYFHQARMPAVIVSFGAAAIALALPRVNKRLPAALLAVIVPTIAVAAFGIDLPGIGQIPRSLPLPTLARAPGTAIADIATAALTVYGLASLETLLSASAVDKLAGRTRHDPDQELIGQGLGNIVSSLFGGIPVTGVIVRSALNVQAGAQTRRAAIFHALILLVVVFVAAPWIERIPQPALAGVLLAVALRMLSPREFLALVRVSKVEAGVYLLTFVVIILADLILGIQIGLMAAFVVAAVRLGQVHSHVSARTHGDATWMSIRGPVTFLSSTRIEALEDEVDRVPPSRPIVFDLTEISAMDVTGAEMLVRLWKRADANGRRVAILGLARPDSTLLVAADPSGRLGDALAFTEPEVDRILNPGDPRRPIERLLAGARRFQRVVAARRALFQKLGESQSPHTLFISCSDSRIVPPLLTSTDPGELFQLRNVGNIVAPMNGDPTPAEGAAVEFAVENLGIREIVVCGHSGCGAMRALLARSPDASENLARWLASNAALLDRLPLDADANTAARANVLMQLEHLETYPVVREKMANDGLLMHGWFYDIPTGELSEWDAGSRRWVSVTPPVSEPAMPAPAEDETLVVPPRGLPA